VGGEHQVAARAVGAFFGGGGGVVDLALKRVPTAESANEELVELDLVEGVEAIDRLVETELILGGLEGLADAVGEVVEVPTKGHGLLGAFDDFDITVCFRWRWWWRRGI
jgi:hypothetical protein